MSRTITAMYASRGDAERAADQLRAMGVSDARIYDSSTGSGSTVSTSGAIPEHEHRGLWDEIKSWFSDDDRGVYEEGVRRGRTVLVAQVTEEEAERAMSLLEGTDALDVDVEGESYRASSYEGSTRTTADPSLTAARSDSSTEERIPVVEEQLAVGKRETVRGGARIRSYVREVPVSEQVRLREERVRVERRPVGEVVQGDSAGLFQDREIEVTERSEEAVVGKRAVVAEEIVVTKDVGERVETVEDRLRRTEVDVEDLGSRETAGTRTDRDR